VNHTATRHPNRKQAAQATENNPTSERKYGKRLTEEVLRLRKAYAGQPGETSHLVYEHFQRRHIRISEEDIDEIIDRHVAALEAELSIVDSTTMASATTEFRHSDIKDPENMACCLRGIAEGLRNFTGALEAYVSALEADSIFYGIPRKGAV